MKLLFSERLPERIFQHMSYKSKCVQCGKEFTLTGSEIDFYKKKNLQIPKRCKECRELNKKNKAGSEQKSPVTAVTNNSSPNKGKNIFIGVFFIILVAVASLLYTDLIKDITDDTLPYTDNSEIFLSETTAFSETSTEIQQIAAATVETTIAEAVQTERETVSETTAASEEEAYTYHFRNSSLLNQHYEKHGIEMGFTSAEEYEKAANAVITDPNALSKREKEDNDYVYYIEETNEFVILSTDGYIRTYFYPDRGKAYYDSQ